MPNLKNQTQISEIQKALSASKAIILANHAGMDVNAQNQLKREIKASGAHITVSKNSLLKIALKEILGGELPENLDKALEGPTSVLYTNDDPVSPTKALFDFIKGHEEKPVLKLGVMDGKVLTLTEIESLSKLPGKQELLAMLVGQLNAPIAGFAQVLRANLQNVVFAFDAIKRSKEVNN
jgi:large subunit ribosomal protein L10